MKILFLHGWTSVVGGRKPTFLKSSGHEVLNPALPDDDFEESVRIAEAELNQHQPDVIVGSSRGGAVAVNMNSGEVPLVLMCPAWKKWGTATTTKQNSIVLHSKGDDVIPFADSLELIANSRLSPETLIQCGDDHRLADPLPIQQMLDACDLVVGNSKECFEGELLSCLRPSLRNTLRRIRMSAIRSGATELPTAEFSDAINLVGEDFVDLLFAKPRSGRWWIASAGTLAECTVQNLGTRHRSVFVKGKSPEWSWFPKNAHRLADPMTGPDHVLKVEVPSLSLSQTAIVEQKLRLSSKQDAFANGSTYVKHLNLKKKLDHPAPSGENEQYCESLLKATKRYITKTSDGGLTYSGAVPHVCFASILTSPNKIFVAPKSGGKTIEGTCVGFLAPTIDYHSLVQESAISRFLQRAKVNLWISLESLLAQCTDEEVTEAWNASCERLIQHLLAPEWRN